MWWEVSGQKEDYLLENLSMEETIYQLVKADSVPCYEHALNNDKHLWRRIADLKKAERYEKKGMRKNLIGQLESNKVGSKQMPS